MAGRRLFPIARSGWTMLLSRSAAFCSSATPSSLPPPDPSLQPRHVAVVMDGSRRWARARGLPAAEGHRAMLQALERTVRLSCAWGVTVLTAFGLSVENLGRPKAEVDNLMALHERFIRDNVAEFLTQGVRLHVIGDSSRRPASLQRAAREAEEATRNNSRLRLILAVCYNGRWDLVQACQQLVRDAQAPGSGKRPEDIDESLLGSRLQTAVAGELSSPDLIIRTSGLQRLSNFLLWQSAYSELYFPNVLWPDFGEREYHQALSSFRKRERPPGL